MRLHCHTHDLYLDIYRNESTGRMRRTFALHLLAHPKGPGERQHKVPPVYACALYWHPDPKPGEVTAVRSGRVLGPCRVLEVV